MTVRVGKAIFPDGKQCWCSTCQLERGPLLEAMPLCEYCGSKRCLRAADHRNRCSSFEQWWYNIGSGMTPIPGDDHETHARRIGQAYAKYLGSAYDMEYHP